MRFLLYTKQRQTLIAFAMMLSLSGCVKDKLDTGREGEVPLKLTLSIETAGEPDTKAPLMGPNFPAGTHNVGLVVSNSTTPPGYYNMLMSVTSDGKGNNTMKYYSGKDGTTEIKEITVDTKNTTGIVAYYPRIEGLQNYSLIPFDLTTAAQKASQTDLLCSPTQIVTVDNAANVPLVFKHVYAMLEFQVTRKYNSAGVAGFRQISVNNKTGKTWVQNKGTMNALTGGIVGTSAGSVAVDYADAVNKVEFGNYTTFRVMVPPFSGAYADDDVEIAFTGLGDAAPQKLLIKKKYLSSMTDGKYAMKAGARYVFKLSYDSSPQGVLELTDFYMYRNENVSSGYKPIVMEYNVAPYGNTTEGWHGQIEFSERNTYNHLYGVNGEPVFDGINGVSFSVPGEFIRLEPPYYKLEVDFADIPVFPGNWLDAKGTSRGGDICAREKGGTWRIPRLTEMMMMSYNLTERAMVEKGIDPGSFRQLRPVGHAVEHASGALITASEKDNDMFWLYEVQKNGISEFSKKETLEKMQVGVRCVREVPLTPVVLEYFAPPYYYTPIPFDVYETRFYIGPSLNSYNGLTGVVGEKSNGFYQKTANYYTRERPYYKFEIDRNDLILRRDYNDLIPMITWRDARSRDFQGDVCRAKRGLGWRMPRISELELIRMNQRELTLIQDFTPLEAGSTYWSATEFDDYTVQALAGSPLTVTQTPPSEEGFVRCIREIPLEPTIMVYGGVNGEVPPEITIASTKSYNNLRGDNSVTPGKNGVIYATAAEAFAGEPPYPRLQIDKEFLMSNVTAECLHWTEMRAENVGGDICTYVRGRGWRMPRLSEALMMVHNLKALYATPKMAIADNLRSVVSATESPKILGTVNQTLVFWAVTPINDKDPVYKVVESARISRINPVRCVKELPLK